ncbi:hypothetical protein HMPREF1139_0028 [Campylobacter sp. FOBRC14]|nr:hypothetical protein HMPREF1139_0028 [Campylobacter sp. FOBRC14]
MPTVKSVLHDFRSVASWCKMANLFKFSTFASAVHCQISNLTYVNLIGIIAKWVFDCRLNFR